MMSIETDGWTRPCCLETGEQAKISPIKDGIINSFNNIKLLDLRENLKSGFNNQTKPYCYRCESLESKNQPSQRTQTKFLSDKRELKLLQFKMSNKCQLTCAHCGPDRSSGWSKLLGITPHIKNAFEVTDVFLEELVKILPQLEVIKFTGGEPFLDPNHWKILEHLSNFNRKHCELHYITNGISPFKPELWEGWKSVKCSISVDGFEETYEWFRRGSNWSELLQNITRLKNITEISINYALTPFTIQDYHKSKNYWNFNFKAFPIVYPDYMSLKRFPFEEIKKIENYQTIPYSNFASGESITYYKKWAENWDKKWGTPGWAEKIIYWMKND